MIGTRTVLAALAVVAAAAPAPAAVVISTTPTQNMSCSGGVCAPTATDAVLNVTDLENLLASGNVEVTTKGSGVQARDIGVRAPLEWTTANELTLDAHDSVSINQQVSVASAVAALAILTNDGGTKGALEFDKHGKITFANLTSQLTINGTVYRLENTLKNLAYDIARKPTGAYALAADYDASGDGVYASSPIGVEFSGTFSGLGNVISKLTIIDNIPYDYVGLFSRVSMKGALGGVRLSRVVVEGSDATAVGGIAGVSEGTISNSEASGRFVGGLTGGLVGENLGTIGNSWSVGSISHTDATSAGGLVGNNEGHLTQDFSTDALVCENYCGGLVSINSGTITDSYATGSASGHRHSLDVGGFVGVNLANAAVETSYSTGLVSGRHEGAVGGFFGANQGSADSSYWDTDTSRTDQGSGDGNDAGITGLTTAQFQSGLPTGFDPNIWAENPNINNGFPYLIHNPPPK